MKTRIQDLDGVALSAQAKAEAEAEAEGASEEDGGRHWATETRGAPELLAEGRFMSQGLETSWLRMGSRIEDTYSCCVCERCVSRYCTSGRCLCLGETVA